MCRAVGGGRERLCAGGWVGWVVFFYSVVFHWEAITKSCALAHVKSSLFCCCRIITGQPSDRKSDGMYTYLHSTIFISPFSPVSLQKLMQLQSWRGSMAKWSGHWSCNPMISSVYRKLDWAVVVGSSEFSFLSTCKYLKIANQLGLSWNSFTYENIFLKISCHTDRATVKECDGQNPIVTPNSASYNHLGPFHKTGTPPGWPCWAKFGGGITQEITSFLGCIFFASRVSVFEGKYHIGLLIACA